MKTLILPLTYEDIDNHFISKDRDSKMMEFVSPLIETETEIATIVKGITTAGKLAFILGNPGIGKSTFLHSLTWRKHLNIRTLIDINANDYLNNGLDSLFEEINRITKNEVKKMMLVSLH